MATSLWLTGLPCVSKTWPLQHYNALPFVRDSNFHYLSVPKIDLSQEKDKEMDYKFTKWMAKNVGVLAIPPSVFYSEENKSLGENYARFCFIKVRVLNTSAYEVQQNINPTNFQCLG